MGDGELGSWELVEREFQMDFHYELINFEWLMRVFGKLGRPIAVGRFVSSWV